MVLYYNMNLLKLSTLFIKYATEYWGRKAAGILFYCKDDSTVFLLHRSKKTMGGETWGIPGGALDLEHDNYHYEHAIGSNIFDSNRPRDPDPKDEVFLDAAIREVEEELGFTPPISIIKSYDFKDGQFTYRTYISLVSKEEKELFSNSEINWEHTNSKWFSIKELPSNLIGNLKNIINSLK